MITGVGIIFSPIAFALLAALRGGASMWNESEGAGAALWLMFLTVPIGGITALVGFIWWIASKTSGPTKN
jgi:hypothetical protein